MSRLAPLGTVLRCIAAPAALFLAAGQGPPPTESTVDRASYLVEHNQCQEAADMIKPVVEANPGSWGAQYAYGRAMVCLGDLKEGRHALEIAVARETGRFEGQDVPRPERWTGWRLIPVSVEFWRDRPFRLHDRMRWDRAGESWTRTRLQP